MVVTVVVSGVPWRESLKTLSKEFDKIFDRDEIGSFRVRELHEYTSGKRQLGLDFKSGYDAMTVQQILDGYVYRGEDNDVSIFKARVLKNSSPQRSIKETVSSSSSSRASTFGTFYHNVSSEELLKTTNVLDAQLQLLEKQKLVLKAERELVKEKKKLDQEYSSTIDVHNSDEEITYKSKKQSKSRYSSSSSEDSRHRRRSKSPKYRRMRSSSGSRFSSPVYRNRRRIRGRKRRRNSKSPPFRPRERMLSPASSRDKTWSQEASTSFSSNKNESRRYRKSISPMYPKSSSSYGREEKIIVIDLTDSVETIKPNEDMQKDKAIPKAMDSIISNRAASNNLSEDSSKHVTGLLRDVSSADALLRCYQDHHRLDHDRLMLKDMAQIYVKDPYSQSPAVVPDDVSVATSTQNYNIWIAVDQFETNDAPSKVTIDKPVPENAQFVTPSRIIMRQMKRHVTEIEKECKQIYQIARQVIRDRLKEIMVGEDYTRSTEIVSKYRKVHNTNDDKDFLKKLRDEINAGKYAEEVNGSEPLPEQTENGDEGNNNSQMITEDNLTLEVKGSEPLPETTKKSDEDNYKHQMITEDSLTLEVKGSEPLPKQTENGDEGNNNNQMITEGNLTLEVKGSEPLPEKTKESDEDNYKHQMITEDSMTLEVKGSEPLPEKGDEENGNNQMTTEDILLILQNQKKEE